MDIAFCAATGCFDAVVGVGYWQGRQGTENPLPPWPNDMCRIHHLERIEPGLVRCKVVGPARIVDTRTTTSVAMPGEVELDPVETNIAALVYAGYVKVLPATKSAAASKTTKE